MSNSLSSAWNIINHIITTGLNDWGSLHPALVHIPIALLLIAPLFIILGLIFQKSAKTFYLSALILLIIGTLSIFLATSTGEKASEQAGFNPDVIVTLKAHYHSAEKIRLNFSILTSTFMAYILLLSFLSKRLNSQTHRVILILFLIVYAYNLILLLNTAHLGGKLVHHHGITSNLFSDKDLIK